MLRRIRRACIPPNFEQKNLADISFLLVFVIFEFDLNFCARLQMAFCVDFGIILIGQQMAVFSIKLK